MNNKQLLNFRKTIVAFILLVSILFCAASCGVNGGNSEGATTKEVTTVSTTPVLYENVLVLAENGTVKCRVIRPEFGYEYEIEAAQNIRDIISRLLDNAEVELTIDWLMPNAETDDSVVDILVGQTTYEESKNVCDILDYNGYSITVSNNKLVVAAITEDGIEAAVDNLAALLKTNCADGSIRLPLDTSIYDKSESPLASLPKYEDGAFSYTSEVGTFVGKTAQQMTYTKTTLNKYNEYLGSLKAAGYELIQNNQIGDNHYASYKGDKLLVTVYYISSTQTVRIIIEDKRDVCQDATAYTSICDTTLWQLGLDENNPDLDSTMNAYIVRLADGSFVLIDTGTRSSAKYQYKYMRSLTPEGEKIIVSAIFITHPHADHIGGFKEFADNYSSDMNVKAVYCNFVAFENQSVSTLDNLNGQWNSVRTAAERLGAKAYVVRTGTKINIADTLFEIIWTPDDFGNRIITDGNEACIVIRMTAGDTKTIFLGDLWHNSDEVMVSMYGKELKCTYITMAHHGYGGCGIAVYQNADPEYILWPALNFGDRAVNDEVLAMSSIKKHYLASEGNVEVILVDR